MAKSIQYGKVGKVLSQSVQKHTGKDWEQWIELLSREGAGAWTYQEIVACLRKKYHLSPWWQHGVALGFEIATGRRKVGQDAKGKYMVTATKSLAFDVKTVWKILLSPQGLETWLCPLGSVRIAPKIPFETKDGFFGEIRTIAQNRRIRMSWQDPFWEKPTIVEVLLVPRPGKKSILVFNHTGIPSDSIRLMLKARWRKAADECGGLQC